MSNLESNTFDWISSNCIIDRDNALRNISLIQAHLDPESFKSLEQILFQYLPEIPDPDRALNNLERLFSQTSAKPFLGLLLSREGLVLKDLLLIFGVSQSFSDLIISYPDTMEVLGLPLRQTPDRAELVSTLSGEMGKTQDDAAALKALRKYKQKQTLRIGGNDILRNRPLEEVTQDISLVAEAALEVALSQARTMLEKRFGIPITSKGTPASCAVVAFGKLGGNELNYSSDIDLMFIYDEEGSTQGHRSSTMENSEFFSRLAAEVVRLLSSHTDRGTCYRVDLRLRPEGQRGPLARSLDSTISYYDSMGRTFERQALIKARTVAGCQKLGKDFELAITPFVYRMYLSFSEINEIKALKKRIEQNTSRQGLENKEVKTGRGGIRDIEFTIQFLQLLNGGDLPEVRQRNTLLGMQALERKGCLTDQEYRVLEDAYRFLRKIEHRLQVLFDLQTHKLPDQPEELNKLAMRLGYFPQPESSPKDQFLEDFHSRTSLTHRILEHLLHQTFLNEEESAPESDLVLDPNPDLESIRNVLGKYQFRDIQAAYQNLMQLAQESVPFLSARRCRHFLASIAPALLRSVAQTPDPDMALLNLEKVTASLGAKTVLWELFSFNPPSLKLYVEICAYSQFLSEILINNPGMIDDLLDSLVLDLPGKLNELQQELSDLCRNAEDLDPIIHSFQDKELLRIGVQDILGKQSIRATLGSLSDLAQAILVTVVKLEYDRLQKNHGVPMISGKDTVCRFTLVALGKLGGRELNYHSDLDLVLLYEAEGRPTLNGKESEDTFPDNSSFFTKLTQRIVKRLSHHGPLGKLYEVDLRLRPTGSSGSLVISLEEFDKYYADNNQSHFWERLMLNRSRLIFGDLEFQRRVYLAIQHAVYQQGWQPSMVDDAKSMREKMEASRNRKDLKRGPGGMADVEFVVEVLQLKHGEYFPGIRKPNIWASLDSLLEYGFLTKSEHEALTNGYDFLMRLQSRIRIVHNLATDSIPEKQEDLQRLARRLGYELKDFQEKLTGHQKNIRNLFEKILARCKSGENRD